MVERGEILWLGIAASLSGGLVGGLLLGIGVVIVLSGVGWGWLVMLAGVPASILPGWIMGYRLGRQL